jgi:hypothetical protein
VARELGTGLVLVRKQGRHHPGASVQVQTAPDWQGRELLLRLHHDLPGPTDRVLVVDDWIETGSQATAIQTLITPGSRRSQVGRSRRSGTSGRLRDAWLQGEPDDANGVDMGELGDDDSRPSSTRSTSERAAYCWPSQYKAATSRSVMPASMSQRGRREAPSSERAPPGDAP